MEGRYVCVNCRMVAYSSAAHEGRYESAHAGRPGRLPALVESVSGRLLMGERNGNCAIIHGINMQLELLGSFDLPLFCTML